ncbi:MAG: carboxypeptidase regulatory-like domain-containing protein [Acidobacteria bacterium]|nr:carboxypeptidase regulatory-like domain-containing protein [Acidobacteriota bacterium]
MKFRGREKAFAVLLAFAAALALEAPAQEERAAPDATSATGWVCGRVFDETHAIVAGAELALYPAGENAGENAETVARAESDQHGAFCLKDLPPGFYGLRLTRSPWPPQPPRTAEVRAGLVNHLEPIELELEPGEPRVSWEESFDGMPPGHGRALLERLLREPDAAGVREVARRLLPKRGVRCDIGRLLIGIDPKPLVHELMRQLEAGYLPPLKTARYIYVIGELLDKRTEEQVMQVLLRRLRDSRRLPADPALGSDEARPTHVGDIAIQAVARVTGKDFGWKYGLPPIQNQSAISAAQVWWRQELERRQRKTTF